MEYAYRNEEYRDTHSEYELNRAAGHRSRDWLPRGCEFEDGRREVLAPAPRAGRRSSCAQTRQARVGVRPSPRSSRADPARMPAAGRRAAVEDARRDDGYYGRDDGYADAYDYDDGYAPAPRRSRDYAGDRSPRRSRGGLVVEVPAVPRPRRLSLFYRAVPPS